jgi:hypothetical protein
LKFATVWARKFSRLPSFVKVLSPVACVGLSDYFTLSALSEHFEDDEQDDQNEWNHHGENNAKSNARLA